MTNSTERGCPHDAIALVSRENIGDFQAITYRCAACEATVLINRVAGDEPTDEEIRQKFDAETESERPTIEGFIEARLAEDEEWARAAAAAEANAGESLVLFVRRWLPAGFGKKYPDPHPLPGDPRRELRQNEALRELLKVASDVDALYSVPAEDVADSIRKTIAAIWSDHPDYQQEWAA